MQGKLYKEVMPYLKNKYGFKDNDSIIKILDEIITDPNEKEMFRCAYKYPNGLPERLRGKILNVPDHLWKEGGSNVKTI